MAIEREKGKENDIRRREPVQIFPEVQPAGLLSEQERTILAGSIRGKSLEEISAEVPYTPGSVNKKKSTIYRKLGVLSETQAALTCVQFGVLNLSELTKDFDLENYDRLTPAEKQVLGSMTSQLGAKSSNKEIGEKLSISDQTAKLHMARIVKKLEVKNRTQAALFHLEVSNRSYKEKKEEEQLSKIEKEIVSGIARGMNFKQIGARMNRSERSIEMIMRRCYQKLGVRSETGGVIKAIEMGAVDAKENIQGNDRREYQQLSSMQKRLFQKIIENPDEVWTKEKLAEYFHITEGSVRGLLDKAYKRMGVHTQAQAVAYVMAVQEPFGNKVGKPEKEENTDEERETLILAIKGGLKTGDVEGTMVMLAKKFKANTLHAMMFKALEQGLVDEKELSRGYEPGAQQALSSSERRILQMILNNPHEKYIVPRIAQALAVDVRIVADHLRRSEKTLGAKSLAQAVLFYQKGLRERDNNRM